MSMTIAEKLVQDAENWQGVATTKDSIFNAISAKGVTVPAGSKLADTPSLVDAIQTGGGGCGEFKVITYDYDGVTILKQEAVDSGQNATAPEDPNHQFLELRGFHGSYENVTEDRNIYALYKTTNDVTVLFFRLSQSVNSMTINVTSYHADGFTYSWDGETPSVVSGTGNKQLNRNLTAGANHYLIIGNVSPNTSIKLGRPNSYICLIPVEQARKNTLKKVYLGNNCGLEVSAFQRCDMLETVVFNETLTDIPQSSFYTCYALKALIIPQVTMFSSSFEQCASLKKIIGNDVTINTTKLFRNCKSLNEISLNFLNFSGFSISGCTSLESFTFPSFVTSTDAVTSSLYIRRCTLPEGLLILSQNTLRSCPFLEFVDIPSTVTTIENYAIYDCKLLKYVIFRPVNPPSIGIKVLTESTYNLNLDVFVPDESLAAYKAVSALKTVWSQMKPLSTFNAADYE